MQSTLTAILPLTVLASITAVFIQRQHVLMCLLALEAMILTLLLFAALMIPSSLFICFIILTVGACEASLGLACLVLMIRSYGNDHISSMTANKC